MAPALSAAQQHPHKRALTVLAYVLIGLVALLPRVIKLDQFITFDEINFWITRSATFLAALRSGDALATAISTHPGVTTMWSGALGLMLREWLVNAGLAPGFSEPDAIALMRLPLVLAHSMGIVIGYGLLRRMLLPAAAFLAALLWAADPFAVAYSRVLHVDGALMTWATVCLLAACCYWHGPRRLALLLLSGVAAGLALLSKSPALLLPPYVLAIALTSELWPVNTREALSVRWSKRRLWPIGLWGAAALITMLMLWPALWTGPFKIYEQIRIGVVVEGAEPHMLGNFFLGQADDAPGLLFYPVVIALRLTPITLLGLFLLPLVWRRMQSSTRRDLATLLAFALLFTLAMSLFPKKFNRYLVPIFPILDILAAVGITGLAQLIAWRLGRRSIGIALVSIVGMAAMLNVAWWQPYSIAAFNQLLGGAQAGARNFTIGWGEGYELAAAWLNEQPDITGVRVVSRHPVAMNPYMRDGAQAVTPNNGALAPATGYVVVYVEQVQAGPPSPPFSDFYGRALPVHTVVVKGVPYAWVYQVPPALAQSRAASFDGRLHLLGIRSVGAAQPGQPLVVQLVWTLDMPMDREIMLFAHVLDSGGQRIAQADTALPVRSWQPGSYVTTEMAVMLPAAPAPAHQRLLIGLYDAASSQRLDLASPYSLDPAVDGPNAMLLLDSVP